MALEKFKISPRWSASKEEIWSAFFEPLPEITGLHQPTLRLRNYIQYGVAAIFIGAIFFVGFAAFYTQNFVTDKGAHLSVNLPDGSTVELNAASKISFKPFWWRFSRDIEMLGEAYFEVKKGSQFVVSCPNGVVTVLGTSFNIKARDNTFSVTCLTGKVQVSASTQKVILASKMEAKMVNEQFVIFENSDATERISWTENKFVFDNAPLEDVLLEIELQYNIHIVRPKKTNYFYTGNFFKTDDPKEVLSIVGKPFGITLLIAH